METEAGKIGVGKIKEKRKKERREKETKGEKTEITLELIKERNLVLGLTQENSIENSIQDCLPYILNYYGLCYYFSSLL